MKRRKMNWKKNWIENVNFNKSLNSLLVLNMFLFIVLKYLNKKFDKELKKKNSETFLKFFFIISIFSLSSKNYRLIFFAMASFHWIFWCSQTLHIYKQPKQSIYIKKYQYFYNKNHNLLIPIIVRKCISHNINKGNRSI